MAAAEIGALLEVPKDFADFRSALQAWTAANPPMTFNEWQPDFAKIRFFVQGHDQGVPAEVADYVYRDGHSDARRFHAGCTRSQTQLPEMRRESPPQRKGVRNN